MNERVTLVPIAADGRAGGHEAQPPPALAGALEATEDGTVLRWRLSRSA